MALLVLPKVHCKLCDLYRTGFPFVFEITSIQSPGINTFSLLVYFVTFPSVMENNVLVSIRLNYMKLMTFNHFLAHPKWQFCIIQSSKGTQNMLQNIYKKKREIVRMSA